MPGGARKTLSLAEVGGTQTQSSPSSSTAVDPTRLKKGDEFSLVYDRGSRAGQRRTVCLKYKREAASGLEVVCNEYDKDGNIFEEIIGHLLRPMSGTAMKEGESRRSVVARPIPCLNFQGRLLLLCSLELL